MTRSCIVGASAGLGRSLAEELGKRGHDLLLVASDPRDLKALAADVAIRFKVDARWIALDLAGDGLSPLIVQGKSDACRIDNLIVVAGIFLATDGVETNDVDICQIITTNMLSPIRLINAFLPDLKDRKHSNIVGVGSVAAGRPRRRNAVYSSSKSGLEFYFEALRHDLVERSCNVQFYRLGFLQTSMTYGKRVALPAMEPGAAATIIADNLGRDVGVQYLPRWWWIIVSALNAIPFRLFRHLNP
ncbi:SDR family NAD(P)-dependent oxidoreductase [Bradyrhizobium sp. AUGA SZCCT0222]|uniref:SDR family NAD(P)-dependent oxidoreductase n=1 Tax=Bradyrhizobium sp. AUGA SZCCT0222 TaxID=2807668 RepID=UPI001BA84261|nr:SDR family NAD(P)-dependent oxidoreductase [Bradyrhizobium sp. AUGA SZCCT0222]MBR1270653.1 SDR family NAD(P)-dependent oxidoreductase [Bradyrhizobium sp. AUGA SZCCT0222]